MDTVSVIISGRESITTQYNIGHIVTIAISIGHIVILVLIYMYMYNII